MSVFETVAATHQKWATDLQACIPKMPPASKASIMREVAHHLACAARLRGQPLPALSIRGQRAEGREAQRQFRKQLRTR